MGKKNRVNGGIRSALVDDLGMLYPISAGFHLSKCSKTGVTPKRRKLKHMNVHTWVSNPSITPEVK